MAPKPKQKHGPHPQRESRPDPVVDRGLPEFAELAACTTVGGGADSEDDEECDMDLNPSDLLVTSKVGGRGDDKGGEGVDGIGQGAPSTAASSSSCALASASVTTAVSVSATTGSASSSTAASSSSSALASASVTTAVSVSAIGMPAKEPEHRPWWITRTCRQAVCSSCVLPIDRYTCRVLYQPDR